MRANFEEAQGSFLQTKINQIKTDMQSMAMRIPSGAEETRGGSLLELEF